MAIIPAPIRLGLLRPGTTFQVLGDSISAQSIYQPNSAPPASAPAWAASTAYTVGQVVGNGGSTFVCGSAGTSASSGSGPAPATSTITDGTASWAFLAAGSNKDGYAGWIEIYSQDTLRFDMSQGYAGSAGGLVKAIVTNGGSGYVNPVLSINNGAAGTLTVAGGVITGVTVTNPGRSVTTGSAWSITDSGGGSGAVLSLVTGGTGSLAVGGCQTADMVARLPDCLASTVGGFFVMGGRNDIAGNAVTAASINTLYAQITGNLKTIYEALMGAGKWVVAVPIIPSAPFTGMAGVLCNRVNRWIRAYCRAVATLNGVACNAAGYTLIACADPTRFLVDATALTGVLPYGGLGAAITARFYDGTHPNPAGRQIIAAACALAAQRFVGPPGLAIPRAYSADDGYDAAVNPGGNYLEGVPWTASTAYTAGQLRSNGGNVYRCYTAGTSAASGGPTATSGTINDGTVQWLFVRGSGASVLAGTGGTLTAATGITYSGTLASGFTLLRGGGSASGTVTAAQESPWSDGTPGQRQVLAFSLGGGTATESWILRPMYGAYAAYGIAASDLGNAGAQFYAEAEVELSGIAGLTVLNLCFFDNVVGFYNYAGASLNTAGGGFAYRLVGAAADPVAMPPRLLLRTAPMVLPPNLGNANVSLNIGFDASGAVGSATATIKVNNFGLFKAAVA